MVKKKPNIELEKIIHLLEVNNNHLYFLSNEQKKDRIHRTINFVKTILILVVILLLLHRLITSDLPVFDLLVKIIEVSSGFN